MIGYSQLLLLIFGKYARFEQPLVWCLRRVIDLVHLSLMPGLTHQFHHWLEEVDVETSKIIDTIESL